MDARAVHTPAGGLLREVRDHVPHIIRRHVEEFRPEPHSNLSLSTGKEKNQKPAVLKLSRLAFQFASHNRAERKIVFYYHDSLVGEITK